MFYKVFTRIISGTVTDHVKFFFNFSHLKPYHKNQVHGLAILNSQTIFEFKLNFLHFKLLGKGIQEQLYFCKVVSIKPTFLAN